MNNTHLARAALAGAGLLTLAGASGAVAAAPKERAAAAKRVAHGQVDADVRDTRGRLLGVLHGGVATSGKGLLTFQGAHGQNLPDVVVGIRTGAGKARGATLTGRAMGTRLTLKVDAKTGDVDGKGTLDRRKVTLDGVAGETEPNLRDGMKMLVVGHPTGKAWTLLRKQFKTVRYDPDKHSRAKLLHDRYTMLSYAGIVFGDDVSASAIRRHGLLRSFYGAGKWIIEAKATAATAAALSEVHPYRLAKGATAIAVRESGPRGDIQRVKPTIVYPATPSGTKVLSKKRRARAATARQLWFRGQLQRFSGAHIRSAKTASYRAGRTLAQAGTNFSLPYGAAAIEIALPIYDSVVLEGGQNVNAVDECGWNQTDNNAWCPDTSFFSAVGDIQSEADGLAFPPDGPWETDTQNRAEACKWFLANGYWMIDSRAAKAAAGNKLDSDGAYRIDLFDLQEQQATFVRKPGDTCPAELSQTMVAQGDDYFYAIYDNTTDQHTVIAQTDVTASAAVGEAMAQGAPVNGNDNPGSYPNGTGWYYRYEVDPLGGNEWNSYRATNEERAYYTSRYTHTLTLTGPQITSTNQFPYLGNLSVPQEGITQSSQTNSTSVTRSFTIGIMGTDGQGMYSNAETEDASVTVDVPDWQVIVEPGERTITYDWLTNTPVPWATINGGGSSSWNWDLNNLNVEDFNPTTLTSWQGAASWGVVNIASSRTLTGTDHYQTYDGASGMTDGYTSYASPFDNTPDAATPVTKGTTPAAGIDLCDSAVMAPEFKTNCTPSS